MLPRQAKLSMVERSSSNGMMETSEGGWPSGRLLPEGRNYWHFGFSRLEPGMEHVRIYRLLLL